MAWVRRVLRPGCPEPKVLKVDSYLRIIAIALGLALALTLTLCSFETSPRYRLVTIRGEDFTLQLANTPQLQERGLRGRSSLAVNGGLLVQLDQPRALVYSTRHTPFPIDVLYFSEEGTVLKIDHLKAEEDNLAGSMSGQPVAGAVLLLGGTTERLRLGIGTRLPALAPRPREWHEPALPAVPPERD